MIRVLIAEDSLVFQRVILSCLEKEKGIQIVGVVDNGIDAVEKCRVLRPDLITMDILMPKMSGLEATKKIMAECPTRIVIISSLIDAANLKCSFEAIQAGAVEVIDKPRDLSSGGRYESVKQRLIDVVHRTMAAEPIKRFSWLEENPWGAVGGMVKDASRADHPLSPPKMPKIAPRELPSDIPPPLSQAELTSRLADPGFVPNAICIGGSTGAPAVLSDILVRLPVDFAVPILIAQHIVRGFVVGMAKWLAAASAIDVRVAQDKAPLVSGSALFAPDDMHLGVSRRKTIVLESRDPGDVYVPSVDRLLQSATRAFGAQVLGVLLSGMGKDGAKGLREMRDAGAVTIAQNRESAVVYGMPKVANEMGGVMREMSPEGITQLLLDLHCRLRSRGGR